MIGDVIHSIDDDFICGLPPVEAFMKCRGPVGSEVELVASRMENGFKTRISDVLVRDQNAPALMAHLGHHLTTSLHATLLPVLPIA